MIRMSFYSLSAQVNEIGRNESVSVRMEKSEKHRQGRELLPQW